MPVNRRLLKQIALGTGIAGGIGGAGYLGHRIGVKSGASRMSDLMGGEFSLYNESENRNIATNAYKKGVVDTLSRLSNFEKISEYSFQGELEKLCGLAPTFRVAKETATNVGKRVLSKFRPSNIKESFKSIGRAGRDLKSAYKKESEKAGSGKEHINKFIESMKKSTMAVGTTAAGVAGVGYAGHKILEKKTQQPYYTYTT